MNTHNNSLGTDVSQEDAASIFRLISTSNSSELFIYTYKNMVRPWRWMQHIPPKCLYPSPRLHGASMKIEAVCSSETCVSTYKTTWYHSPGDHSLSDRRVRIARNFGAWPEVARNKFRRLRTCVKNENRSRIAEVELWILKAPRFAYFHTRFISRRKEKDGERKHSFHSVVAETRTHQLVLFLSPSSW
jgi:hypothetical protein